MNSLWRRFSNEKLFFGYITDGLTLNNPKNQAVFLVAHSSAETTERGLTSATLIESNHLKINEVVKSVHPNLKFLSLIGCKEKALIEEYKKKFYHQEIEVFGFSDIVEARRNILFPKLANGLKKSIIAFKENPHAEGIDDSVN